MRKSLQSLAYIGVLSLLFLAAQGASAHIFIDEGFEDGLAFNRAPCPDVTDVDSDVDTFDDNEATHTPCLTITGTGAIETGHALGGNNSYVMTAGQGFGADVNPTTPTQSWTGQTTGPFQYVQMGVSVANITAPAGTEVARLTMTWQDMTPNDWVIIYESDGAGGVNILGGQDSQSKTQIGHIAGDQAEWEMVTLMVEKNLGPEDDPLVGNDFMAGAYWFAGSYTPGLHIPAQIFVSATQNPKAMDVRFDVSHGSVYVDNVYWEGGMTATDEGRDFTDLRNFSAFTVPVILDQFKLE